MLKYPFPVCKVLICHSMQYPSLQGSSKIFEKNHPFRTSEHYSLFNLFCGIAPYCVPLLYYFTLSNARQIYCHLTTGGPTMSYDWNNIVFIFKTYLNPLIIDYFFSRSSVNILNCLESLYYHSTWRFTKYRWSLTSKNVGAKRRRRRKKG